MESDKLIQYEIEQGIAMERKKAEVEIQHLKKLLEEQKQGKK